MQTLNKEAARPSKRISNSTSISVKPANTTSPSPAAVSNPLESIPLPIPEVAPRNTFANLIEKNKRVVERAAQSVTKRDPNEFRVVEVYAGDNLQGRPNERATGLLLVDWKLLNGTDSSTAENRKAGLVKLNINASHGIFSVKAAPCPSAGEIGAKICSAIQPSLSKSVVIESDPSRFELYRRRDPVGAKRTIALLTLTALGAACGTGAYLSDRGLRDKRRDHWNKQLLDTLPGDYTKKAQSIHHSRVARKRFSSPSAVSDFKQVPWLIQRAERGYPLMDNSSVTVDLFDWAMKQIDLPLVVGMMRHGNLSQKQEAKRLIARLPPLLAEWKLQNRAPYNLPSLDFISYCALDQNKVEEIRLMTARIKSEPIEELRTRFSKDLEASHFRVARSYLHGSASEFKIGIELLSDLQQASAGMVMEPEMRDEFAHCINLVFAHVSRGDTAETKIRAINESVRYLDEWFSKPGRYTYGNTEHAKIKPHILREELVSVLKQPQLDSALTSAARSAWVTVTAGPDTGRFFERE